LTGKAFHWAFGRSSLFVSSFNEVQERRELLATDLNGKMLERANMCPTKVVDCVMEWIQDLTVEGNLDCKTVSQHFAFTLLGATLIGDAFLAWSKATVYEDLLKIVAKDACFWASYVVSPFWKQGFWRYQCFCTRLKLLTQDIIQHCKRKNKLFTQMDHTPHDKTRNRGGEDLMTRQEIEEGKLHLMHHILLTLWCRRTMWNNNECYVSWLLNYLRPDW